MDTRPSSSLTIQRGRRRSPDCMKIPSSPPTTAVTCGHVMHLQASAKTRREQPPAHAVSISPSFSSPILSTTMPALSPIEDLEYLPLIPPLRNYKPLERDLPTLGIHASFLSSSGSIEGAIRPLATPTPKGSSRTSLLAGKQPSLGILKRGSSHSSTQISSRNSNPPQPLSSPPSEVFNLIIQEPPASSSTPISGLAHPSYIPPPILRAQGKKKAQTRQKTRTPPLIIPRDEKGRDLGRVFRYYFKGHEYAVKLEDTYMYAFDPDMAGPRQCIKACRRCKQEAKESRA